MARSKNSILLTTLILVAVSVVVLFAFNIFPGISSNDREEPSPDPNLQQSKPDKQDTTVPVFDRSKHSISEPASIWVVVNKLRPLEPLDYSPTDLRFPDVRLRVPGHETMKLRTEAATALESMFNAAKTQDNIELMLSSAYRSYAYQENLYNGYVNRDGKASADTYSARPGHSEHQTGLAADIRPTNGQCELDACFGDMEEGLWIANNAHRFGFIIRYTRDNTAISGYTYEPWHIRYVGIDLAQELQKQKISTLEEFFDLPAAPDYASLRMPPLLANAWSSGN